MKKYLLSQNGNFYKANLHCHSTFSDGDKTPSQIKSIYQKMGYSIVAYTDHDIFIPHDELTDDSFLALHGFEVEITEKRDIPREMKKTCHICFIALDEDNLIQPMWNENCLFGNAPKYKDLVKFDETEKPYVRFYNSECISEMMRIGREKGFFVTYNHPTWSKESYPEYINYTGMHALEMFNGSCILMGYEDYNPRVYDDMLTAGKRIYCIGADDNHNKSDVNTRYSDSGIAYTVIKADSLEYKSVTDALINGNFYCSQGPSIYELWIEDNKIHIKCSEADSIKFICRARKCKTVFAEDDNGITSASFDLVENCGYVRLTVTDKYGKHACTNAYFID